MKSMSNRSAVKSEAPCHSARRAGSFLPASVFIRLATALALLGVAMWHAPGGRAMIAEAVGLQDQGIRIHPVAEATTSLAVVKYAIKGDSNPESETALKIFNDVLWAD